MSVEPGISWHVEQALSMTDWSVYRKCRICRAEIGEACEALYSRVENGAPAGARRELLVPHGFRQRRRGR